MSRSLFGSMAAVCMLALLVAVGCKPKAEVNASPTINPPTTGAPDPGKLPTDDPYATPKATPLPTPVVTPLPPPVDNPPVGGGKVHTLSKGETIYSLGRLYYGTANNANFNKIKAANPQIKDFDHVPAGTKINIP